MNAAEEPSWPTPAASALLFIGPVNDGNNKGKSINYIVTLCTMLVEPTYLQKISNATFSNANMQKFVELAQILSHDFWIIHCGGIPLVFQCSDSLEQIVLPSGFQILATIECHGSSLTGHLDTCKTLELLHSYVWWPKLHSIFCTIL